MARANLKKDFRDGDKLYGQQLNNNFGTIEAALDAMNKIAWQDDPDESVTAFRGTTEQIQSQPIIDGQLLYDISTGETYTDYNGERVSTGSGNAIHIGADTPDNDATQIWIDPTEPVTNIGTEVVNSLDGDETHMSPSVHAIKSANTYSTDEVKTGETWIDGYPIYRKVINATIASTQTGRIEISHEIENINNIINVGGFVKHDNPKEYIALPVGIALDNVAQYSYSIQVINNTKIVLFKGTGFNVTSNVYCILEYTKTTDGSDS